ncbi:RbsD/FucU domain-containing protein [Tessaracoccus coleopterorum]|uniref:RbsD/FucU domain-containing protein n=1 Tax=Tessaracoccus coleopterorum TaxID=2714950 RepID=UPI002F908665
MSQILEVIKETIPIEQVAIMVPADDATGVERPDSIPAHDEYRATMAGTPFVEIKRWDFYEAAKSSDVTVYVMSGDQRLYANVMLTVGVRTSDQ